MNNKIFLILLFLGVCYCAYMGGRQEILTDKFFIKTEHKGMIDCFEFNCMNGTCLFCSNSKGGSGLVYMRESSNGGHSLRRNAQLSKNALNVGTNPTSCNHIYE